MTDVWLDRGRDRTADVDAVADAHGGRVGLEGVIDSLDRTARPVRHRGLGSYGLGIPLLGRPRRARWAFAWDAEDQRSPRWWPQGVTSSADASGGGLVDGRRLVLVTAYAKRVGGAGHGSRVTVADVTDPGRVRYTHVLLVVAREDGGWRPLSVHAGGLAWAGGHLHVAATAKGLFTARVSDVVRVDARDAFGHRHVLPVRHTHEAGTAEGATPFRYSFVAVDRERARLLAGEYGHGSMTTRLLAYPLDRDGLPGRAPEDLGTGPERMQGVAAVGGTLVVTSSRGRFRGGSLCVRGGGTWREHRWALPPGPEDLALGQGPELLTVTEYPRRRLVLAVDAAAYVG